MPIRKAEFSGNGETIVTFSNTDQQVTEISFWNGADFTWRSSFTVRGYCWSHLTRDGTTLFVGNGPLNLFGKLYGTFEGNVIRIYDTHTGQLKSELASNGSKIKVGYGLTAVSANGRFLATESDRKILVWDVTEKSATILPKYEITPANPKKRVSLTGFTDDPEFLLASEKDSPTFYDPPTGKPLNVPANVAAKLQGDDALLTPDQKYSLVQSCGLASVYDRATNQALHRFKLRCAEGNDETGSSYEVRLEFVHIDGSGKLLLDIDNEHELVRVRNLKTGEILQTLAFPKKTLAKSDRPRWRSDLWGHDPWWIQGGLLFAPSQDERSILVWKVNADSVN